MSLINEPKLTNIQIDQNNLYREESFTDLTFATIRRLTPIKVDGSPDESREVIFTAMTQLMSPNGPVPVQCLIDGAKTLGRQANRLPPALAGVQAVSL